MTNQAIKLGYITEGQTINDIPESKMDDFARDLVKSVGAGQAKKMVNVQVRFKANQSNGSKNKVLKTQNTTPRTTRVLKVRH